MRSSPSKQLHSVIDGDGAAILDIEQNAMITLNHTGGFVWQRLQQGKSVDEIVADLAAQTGTDVATIERDVRQFLEQLKVRHLLGD